MNKKMPILTGRNITVRFGEGCPYCMTHTELEKGRCPFCHTIWAVRDVSFNLYPGEILGIVGESGSGKSTLLKTLYFDVPATAGDVRLTLYHEGKDNILHCSTQNQRYLRNHLMGMVYQNPMLGLRMDLSSGANIAEKLIAAGNRNAGQHDEAVSRAFAACGDSGRKNEGCAQGVLRRYAAACTDLQGHCE